MPDSFQNQDTTGTLDGPASGLSGLPFEANSKDALSVNRFQILSLDGGGIKGIFSAALLAAIEDDLKVNVADHFDLITGTSTGGIIALGLSLGMRPKEIVEFYVSNGPKIFSSIWGLTWLRHWVCHKYSAKPLKNALVKCFKERKLGDCIKRAVITSFNLGDDDVYLFRTPHAERLKRDYKVEAWKVALATSAAPTYFPVARDVDHLRLIDGGVWANNPTLVGVTEAIGTLQVPVHAIKVLSIGTSQPVIHRRNRLNWGGLIPWAFGGAAVDVIMTGQSIAVDKQAAWLLGRDDVLRINPIAGESEYSLDGVCQAQDLIAKAAHNSRIMMPAIQKQFLGHTAPPYKPWHS